MQNKKYLTIKKDKFSLSDDMLWQKLAQPKYKKHLRVIIFMAHNLQYKTNMIILDYLPITTKKLSSKLKIHIRNIQITLRFCIENNIIARLKGKYYFNPYIQAKGLSFRIDILKLFKDYQDNNKVKIVFDK